MIMSVWISQTKDYLISAVYSNYGIHDPKFLYTHRAGAGQVTTTLVQHSKLPGSAHEFDIIKDVVKDQKHAGKIQISLGLHITHNPFLLVEHTL